VVKFTLYMRDLGQIAAFRTVRDRYIHPGHQPACTSIEVARFHDDQFLIVLEAIIRVPDHE
jgi:enamine deaminase RidA (YjgF/YER057c/UK114 family)